ncbi:MAG: chorismate synthase [Candidatus Cloacimonetes bacterium]|nr:chorismate synthase [Candidatus Cloacimonadota bacterium]
MPSNRLEQFFGFTSFGESHGAAMGLLIDSPTPNLDFPYAALRDALNRRKIHTPFKTSREETDDYEILSGVFEGKTTGMPLCIIVRNRDIRSSDYEAIRNLFRPGHADFAWFQKFGIYDFRGGGRASGRETLVRVIAASFTDEVIQPIQISTSCLQIGTMRCETTSDTHDNPFHWQDSSSLDDLYSYLQQSKDRGESLGGIIRLTASRVPAGLGDPVYEKLSANIAKAMLSIPSVKGINFGDGFALASMQGSEANDQISSQGFLSNHQGGINGGVSNGNDIVFDLIIRPIPSVSTPQRTIDREGKDHWIEVHGRHDSCHIPRLIPVAEAMLKLCLADAIQHQRLIQGKARDLVSFRESLDKIDEDLLLLLYRRRQIVQQVKEYKLKHQLPNHDPIREQQIISRAQELAKELDIDPNIVSQIIQLVLNSSQ